MGKVIIVGAGFAGLSAGVYLSKEGFSVEILEASQKLGGRAYSLIDKETGTSIDNGQHILMGACTETLNFLKLINAENNITHQKKLKVNFLKEEFNLYHLEAKSFPYPFNLLFGLLTYKAITFRERLSLLRFFSRIYLYSNSYLSKLAVFQWLLLEKQNENVQKAFWEILSVGILNTDIKKASAKTFADVLKKIFFRGNKASSIILPKIGLSEMYCKNSRKFIEENGGKINLSETVESLTMRSDAISEIKTNKRTITDFDYLIFAVPYYSFEKILSANSELFEKLSFHRKKCFNYSSILNVHIWFNKNELEESFYGLIRSKVHWIFNHGTHITAVISDADHLIEKSKEELFEIVFAELEKFIKLKRENVLKYKVIKERRATFVPSNEIIDKRPGSKTEIKNLFLAGDWVDTGFPSTIESAVKSGKTAAEHILENGR